MRDELPPIPPPSSLIPYLRLLLMRYLLFLFLLTFYNQLQAQPCREVVAFYPSWKWYDRGRLVNPSTIDYSKYTVINYAFFKPEKNGSISLFDPYADKTILLGEIGPNAKRGYEKNNEVNRNWHIPGTSLIDKAHENGVKVFISIGGWTMSENFSAIANNAEKRQQFAASCANLVLTYRVDGIDIDWEYPGNKAQNGNATDRENFTLLLKEVRYAFDILQRKVGKKLWLTADFGAGASHAAQIEWEQVVPLLDHINVMTYDFYGSTPGRTNHHSPLYPPRKGMNGYDLDSSVRNLIENHYVPPSKINIGLAFFGRSLRTKGEADIHTASHRSADEKTFAADNGAPAYYNILASQHLFYYHWDDYAETPYLSGKRLNTFVTFDDENSIRKKGKYILDNGLSGAIVWDIMSDYVESKSRPGTIEKTPLADALKDALCNHDGMIAHAVPVHNKGTVEILPQQWSLLTHRSFAPRLAYRPKPLSKKEKKAMKKRLKKKRKNSVPKRYFDGGW